ncbi:acyltransferase family protein [Actinomadura xylanilytica]|uniref:acyltransferase family protein n=1 Tax=Actinomadura xylanilytica TaxID=887459 RepID=UPI00255A7157|nr:acyltransferase [Actinomadura xylanilytica]MDL4775363.1 acyltransferase [Actinomadura xylanilytica]
MARLGWLDVLRGWAALLVALHHASYLYVPGLQVRMAGWFDPGRYGVLVFFLVSGYIVPASLERRGSVREFWIGRVFRIYPLLAAACAVAVLPFLLGLTGLRAGLERYDPVTAVLAHLTMLQDLLAVPNAMNVLWTLSYEMVFYLLIVALFVVGAHRRSVPAAAGVAAAALLVGGLLPMTLLSRVAGTGTVAGVTAAVFLAAIAAAMSGRPAVRTAGGLLGGLLALVLVTLNGRIAAWEGMSMLAVMFTGTVLYRAEHGQVGRRTAAVTAGFVLLAVVGTGVWNTAGYGTYAWHVQIVWSGSIVAAAVTFGAAWLLRRRRFPRWATALGTASFSVYLLHPLMLMLSNQFFGTTGREEVPKLVAFVVVLLAVSWAAQRLIEAPAQRLGRRIARPTRVGEPAPVTVPVS